MRADSFMWMRNACVFRDAPVLHGCMLRNCAFRVRHANAVRALRYVPMWDGAYVIYASSACVFGVCIVCALAICVCTMRCPTAP